MFGRSKEETNWRASPSCRRSAISARVCWSAVAVSAMRGTSREALVQDRQLDVLGPEVVAPLRHAVRFVDGEQGDLRRLEQLQAARRHQALGRDVDQVDLAGAHQPLDAHRLFERLGRVEEGGAHADFGQRVDLVLHQRDQRRDDHADAVAQQRRDLVAQRLAAAGRHQHQRVAAAGDVFDDVGLLAAEGRVAEDGFQMCRARAPRSLLMIQSTQTTQP